MSYYDLHPFTEAQALHAAERVLHLMRNRRFFLYKQTGHEYYVHDYGLHPKIFAEAIALEEAHIASYREARERAREAIQQFEANNNIVPAQVPQGKSIIEYSRYTGGFDICRVYPLAAFAKFVPESLEALAEKLFQERMGNKTEEDVAPKLIRTYREEAEGLASTIWEQLQAIDAGNLENNRCLVLLQSRISMGGYEPKNDFAQGRIYDMQDFPFALGFLFYEYSKECRIVQHNHVVFSTSRDSHVNVQHWSESSEGGGQASIRYNASGGYDCNVVFATVL